MINSFKRGFYFLSNFYPCIITFDGIVYRNTEAAFQAQKTTDLHMRTFFSYYQPNEAKYMGRKLRLRPDWENIKDEVMHQICLAKFNQNPELKMKLVSTGNQLLCEGNEWHDNYWGSCTCKKCESKEHLNHLGLILMQIREEYRKDF